MLKAVDDARTNGLLSNALQEPAGLFVGKAHDTRASVFTRAMDAEEMALSAKMRAEREQYIAGMARGQLACWAGEDVAGTRLKLPVYAHRQQTLDTVAGHTVTILCGETGCGKSTQVPQYLLEALVDTGMGARARILVTQPRRISAISVAERVAMERGEALGASVGYKIRLEGVAPRLRGSILFCTVGIVLRMLLDSDALLDVSHLVIDEVHERDVMTDFLLIILRDILPRRPHLRVVLMSATIKAKLFQDYFGSHGYPCPIVTVAGAKHNVEQYMLEDVIAMTRYDPVPAIAAARHAEGAHTTHGFVHQVERFQEKYGEDRTVYCYAGHTNHRGIDLRSLCLESRWAVTGGACKLRRRRTEQWSASTAEKWLFGCEH